MSPLCGSLIATNSDDAKLSLISQIGRQRTCLFLAISLFKAWIQSLAWISQDRNNRWFNYTYTKYRRIFSLVLKYWKRKFSATHSSWTLSFWQHSPNVAKNQYIQDFVLMDENWRTIKSPIFPYFDAVCLPVIYHCILEGL